MKLYIGRKTFRSLRTATGDCRDTGEGKMKGAFKTRNPKGKSWNPWEY